MRKLICMLALSLTVAVSACKGADDESQTTATELNPVLQNFDKGAPPYTPPATDTSDSAAE